MPKFDPSHLAGLEPKGPFVPCVWYTARGDQLKVYWDDEPAYAESFPDSPIQLQRRMSGKSIVTGCKIWGFIGSLETENHEGVIPFKPWLKYVAETDTLIIRWLPTEGDKKPFGDGAIIGYTDAADPKMITGIDVAHFSRYVPFVRTLNQ